MRYLTTIPLKLKTSSGEVELKPGDTFRPDNPGAIKTLLRESKVKPVRDILSEKYNQIAEWLHSHDLTSEEIKESLPELYQDIQDAIEKLDHAFINEDIAAFQDALDKVRLFYTEAMLRCGRKIAVRVYSEILRAFLWVVSDSEDIQTLRGKEVKEPIYTLHEITQLKKLSKEYLKEIHQVKEVFPMSTIEDKVNFGN